MSKKLDKIYHLNEFNFLKLNLLIIINLTSLNLNFLGP